VESLPFGFTKHNIEILGEEGKKWLVKIQKGLVGIGEEGKKLLKNLKDGGIENFNF